MRRNLKWLFTALFVLSCVIGFALTAGAQEQGTCGTSLTWSVYENENGIVLEIGGEGAMDNYTAGNLVPWNSYKSTISEIVFSEDCAITSIGNYAFSGLSAITSVSIPASVTQIGNNAFAGCTALTEIELPANLKQINPQVFYNCKTLKSIEIPDSVEVISFGAFVLCSNLSEIYLGSGLKSIENSVFMSCTSLNKVYYNGMLPDWKNVSILETGNVTFNNAEIIFLGEESRVITKSGTFGTDFVWTFDEDGLLIIKGTGTMPNIWNGTNMPWVSFRNDIKSIIIYEGVTSIGGYAFYNSMSLESVYIPDSVTSIQAGAFRACVSLTEIDIPDKVVIIGDGAFSGCTLLKNVTLGSSVYTIFPGAFSSTGIEALHLPASVTNLSGSAFYGCEKLVEITVDAENEYLFADEHGVLYDKNKTKIIYVPQGYDGEGFSLPKTVTEIGDYAFYSCEWLYSDMLHDGIKTIGNNAYTNCPNLRYFWMPDSVTKIGSSAFMGCQSLYSLRLSQNITTIPSGLITNCHELYYVDIPESVTTIENSAFGQSGIEWIVLPDSVTSMGQNVFMNCWDLEEVVLPTGITSIPLSTFRSCSSLVNITIPESVTDIGNYAFANCSALENVIYEGTQEKWASITVGTNNEPFESANIRYETIHYYEDAESLFHLTTDGKLTVNGVILDYLVAEYCDVITSAVIGSDVEVIPSVAFSDCTKLTSVDISEGVTGIDGGAFSHCTALKNISIPESVEYIGDHAFAATDIEEFYIGAAVEYVAMGAFYNCANLKNITVHDDNAYYWDTDGVLFELIPDYGITLHSYPAGKEETSYTVPDDVECIYCYAFGEGNLESIVIGKNVKEILMHAFEDAYSISTVYYKGSPDCFFDDINVEDYGNEVLFDAKIVRLVPASGQCGENVMWHFDGSGVLTISGTGEMYYTEYPEYYDFCEEIEKIMIEQGVTSISDYAFSFMEYLTQVSIPASVTHIGTAAFIECSSLETVIYYGTVASREQLELEKYDNGNLLDAEWVFWTDPYTISEIRLLDLTMTEIEDVPEGDFNVAVTVTNNSFEYVALYMICAYDEKGTLICSDFLYASPEVGGSVVFGTQISNSDGKAVKIKAFVFDAQNPLSPIAEAAEWSIE